MGTLIYTVCKNIKNTDQPGHRHYYPRSSCCFPRSCSFRCYRTNLPPSLDSPTPPTSSTHVPSRGVQARGRESSSSLFSRGKIFVPCGAFL